MKFKTTSKELKNKVANRYLWKCGYCDLQSLFHYISPVAYTCGTYGWNYDVYDIDGVVITTGYRSMIGQPIPHELIREYEQKAKDVVYNYSIDYDKKKDILNSLVREFIKKLYA